MMNFLPALPGLTFHALLHLLIVGTLVRLAVAVVLRGSTLRRLGLARPRARYLIAVGGFVTAVALPFGLQLTGLHKAATPQAIPYNEQELVEASWSLGNSAQWPLRAANHEFDAWRLWLSLGPWSRDLLTIWAIGILTLTAWSLLGGWRFSRQRRTWTPAPDALRQTLEFPADVPLFVGPTGSPLATGLWRPQVYLPSWSTMELGVTALRRIARHELAHVRWRDPLVDRGIRIVRGILWPAWPLWSLARLVRREREIAADRAVIAVETASHESKQVVIDYAETLLAVAARRGGLVPLVGAAGELEERVRRLLSPGRSPALATTLLVTLLFIGTATIVASPLPVGSAAVLDFSHSQEDIRNWGPLDHFLGFNPRIEFIVAPGVRRLRIQGHELDAEQMDRWENATSLAEKAEMVLNAENLARRARANH